MLCFPISKSGNAQKNKKQSLHCLHLKCALSTAPPFLHTHCIWLELNVDVNPLSFSHSDFENCQQDIKSHILDPKELNIPFGNLYLIKSIFPSEQTTVSMEPPNDLYPMNMWSIHSYIHPETFYNAFQIQKWWQHSKWWNTTSWYANTLKYRRYKVTSTDLMGAVRGLAMHECRRTHTVLERLPQKRVMAIPWKTEITRSNQGEQLIHSDEVNWVESFLHVYLELVLLVVETGKWWVMVLGLDIHYWCCQRVME